MPMFDFYCSSCELQFEELVFGDEKATCPQCGLENIDRMVSAPSPLKTGAFPYKVGPVHSRLSMAKENSSSCGSSCPGTCSSNS